LFPWSDLIHSKLQLHMSELESLGIDVLLAGNTCRSIILLSDLILAPTQNSTNQCIVMHQYIVSRNHWTAVGIRPIAHIT
jgi:hypothetical protein